MNKFQKGTISKGFRYEDIEFVNVKFEESSIDGRPDLVVFARERWKEIPILVIETKRKVPRAEHKFDLFSKDVIAQGERYATWLGSPYFATCDGYTLVLFETFKVVVPLPQVHLKFDEYLEERRIFSHDTFAKIILLQMLYISSLIF